MTYEEKNGILIYICFLEAFDLKLLALDGNSIINRAFYGIPDLTNAAGMHTNAVYGFLNTAFSL